MLEKINLSKKLSKLEYKPLMSELEIKLGELQRKAREQNVPIIILFEGWDAAGKGTLINRLILAMDPRGYNVHSTLPPTEEEKFRPFLWRFWIKIPERGRIAIFDRSWYGRVLHERVDQIVKKNIWFQAYNEINSFERQLADDGYIVLKFFLHITKKEQKKRFEKLIKNHSTSWRVTEEDRRHHKQYQQYFQAFEDMLAKTDTEFAPWTIIEAHDRRFATVKIFNSVVKKIENKIQNNKPKKAQKHKAKPINIGMEELTSSILDKADLSLSLNRKEYEKELKKYQKRIREIEHKVYVRRIPIIIIYQGWDAAGKGGNIKRLVQGMDPRGYEVIPISAPNEIELNHHYLWRFWMKIPKAGHIAVFDRSWYGRVLVERIEGFCAEDEWKRAYREINEMEEQLVNFGTVIFKFWIHIDRQEQLSRFKARESNLYKNWKISDEDWRNRKKWNQYKIAIDEMLLRTSTGYAPWTIVEGNCKWHARIKVLKTVVDTVEKYL